MGSIAGVRRRLRLGIHLVLTFPLCRGNNLIASKRARSLGLRNTTFLFWRLKSFAGWFTGNNRTTGPGTLNKQIGLSA